MRTPITRARLWDTLRRAQGVARLERRLAAHTSQLAQQGTELGHRLDVLESKLDQLDHFVSGDLRTILRAIAAEDAENRRRLWRARADPDYERAYTDPKPLVSVVIATFDRPALLRERSLPSVLGQTYENLEVIVVGDHAAPEVRDAALGLGDPRVSFRNLTQRLPPNRDPRKEWAAGSWVLARNEGIRLARGLWINSFDDDDFLRPEAVETRLNAAREAHAELVYGRFRMVAEDGEHELGEFPPREGQFAFQASMFHGGIRFFERELVSSAFDKPSDAFCMESMLRAGVRFHMIPTVVFDYYPSGRAG